MSCYEPTAIYHTMRDVGNAQQTVCKRREMERKKTFAVIRLHSDELEKFLARTGGIPSGSWICLKHTNKINRNDKRCSCPSSCWHSRKLATCTWPLSRLENLFQTTNLEQTGVLHAKSRWTKIKDDGKYIPRKRETCNKQKVERFLTLISISSRCTS